MKRIALFASGSGSNAEKICAHIAKNPEMEITLVLTNNPEAGVIKRARKFGIPTIVFDKKSFYETQKIQQILKNEAIDFVVLAGFMMLIPESLVKQFPKRMVNIHPALLPKYGGKGMYGHFVHEAVKAAAEKESGITIHYVNEQYDEGDIVFQAKCSLSEKDDAIGIAQKVLELEHQHYPVVLQELVSQLPD
ncbi:phosphoribosylglycinamide formyltransferase [Dyadobacter tibetensis]|uniref:phosphoribosylglycinamide formyltransferase n=1 Tax=Dyadobacter tibetensis TaxID=1211851 RepID=UPI00046FDFA6|nr:phosphoribosylglycinamide formyltransferase [Dyadobacter tibetensis]